MGANLPSWYRICSTTATFKHALWFSGLREYDSMNTGAAMRRNAVPVCRNRMRLGTVKVCKRVESVPVGSTARARSYSCMDSSNSMF